MYDALDVANYVIKYCQEYLYRDITNLQLQKILYYIQAAFLVRRDKPIFIDSIEAWKYGPVIKEVYHEFKYYLDGPIREISPNILSIEFEEYDPYRVIDIYDQNIIDEVVGALIDSHGYTLIKRTHEELPWIEAYGTSGVVNLHTMKEYFKTHRERIYGG